MRHLKSTAFLLIAALAVIPFASLTACGSSEPGGDSSPTASSMATYHNDEYGFSFAYPESYVSPLPEVTDVPRRVVGAYTLVFSVVLFNCEETAIGDHLHLHDRLAVDVWEQPHEVVPEGPQMEESVQEFIEESVQEFIDSPKTRGENSVVVEPLEPAEINGVPGFKCHSTYTWEGTERRVLTYFLVDGKQRYELNAQAVADRWDEVSPELEAALMSFRLD